MEGTPAATNEAAAKSRVHFADPAIKTVSLDKITAFIKESEEYIHDYAFLASAINGRLLYELALTIQDKLVYDLMNTSGIQSDSTHWTAAAKAADLADMIYGASMDIQQESGFAADAIIINPVDWKDIRLGKDGEDRYYGGGYFGDGRPDNVWGIPACVTTAVDPGTIIVGAFKTCGSVVNSEGVRIESTNSDVDDFQKNLMTIRCEERLALAVRRPKGFKVLEKVTGATGTT
jgi:HK97 family phage major capsid protein